jgi:hypothetical protein
VEQKPWPARVGQAKLYVQRAQVALDTVKVGDESDDGAYFSRVLISSSQGAVENAMEIRSGRGGFYT